MTTLTPPQEQASIPDMDEIEASELESMSVELRNIQERRRAMQKPSQPFISRHEWRRLYWSRVGTKALRGEFP